MDSRTGQDMEDVESTGSAPTTRNPLLGATANDEEETSNVQPGASTAGSSYQPMLRPRSVSPSRYGSFGHGIALKRPRAPPKMPKVSAAIGTQISALQERLTEATSPLAQQVAQTSATAGQAQTLAGEALERTEVLKGEAHEMRATLENALKEQFAATSEMTSARMQEAADALSQKMLEVNAQVKADLDRAHAVELAKVRSELQELRVASGQTITSVQHSSAEESTKLQMEMQKLRQELEEQKHRKDLDATWYADYLSTLSSKQESSHAYAADLKTQVLEKTVKIDQMHQTMAEMMEEMKAMRVKMNEMENQARTTEFSFGNAVHSEAGNGSGSHTSPPRPQMHHAFRPAPMQPGSPRGLPRATETPERRADGGSRSEGRPAAFGNVQWRPKEPPIFAGRLSDDVVQWFRIVKDYLHFMGGTAEMHVSYIVTLLTGAARDYWDNYVNSVDGVRPATVRGMEALFVDRFGHASRHKENLHKMLTMRQGKQNVREFAREFENACGKLSSYDDSWAMQIFTWALQRDIALQVSMAEPVTLAEAIQKAENVDMAMRYASMTPKGSTGQASQQQPRRPWRGGYRGGYARGNGRQMQRTRGRSQGRTSDTNRLTCYSCGQVGHIAPNCPRNQSQRGGGRFGRGGRRGGGRRGGHAGRLAAMHAEEDIIEESPEVGLEDAHPHQEN